MLGFCVLGFWVPGGSVLNSDSSQDRLAVWLRAVDQHEAGALDEHVKALGPWTAAVLNAVLDQAIRGGSGSDPMRLKRAAWLHADVAILHRRATDYGVASTGAASTVVSDGQLAGALGRTPHWAFARRLLDESRRLAAAESRRVTGREPPPDEDARLWYRATAAFLQSWDEYVELVPHLTNALGAFPDDPVLLLIKGTMHEYFAEPPIQVAVEQQRRLKQDVASVGSIQVERHDALRAFDAALRKDPAMVEARIRRANVLQRLGRHREVIDELLPLLDAPPTGTLGYWLHLIHGRTLLALDQPKGARTAFAAAVALAPHAQTPWLGLAQVAMRLGEVVDPETLALRAGHTTDPWLTYHQNHVPHADELVARMRQRWPR